MPEEIWLEPCDVRKDNWCVYTDIHPQNSDKYIRADLAYIRNSDLPDPHERYGPCDALGPNGSCAECIKLYSTSPVTQEEAREALKRIISWETEIAWYFKGNELETIRKLLEQAAGE